MMYILSLQYRCYYEEKIKSKTKILLILLIATCTVATESLCLHEATGASNHLSLDQSKQSVRIAQIGNIVQMGSVMPN